MMTTTVTNQDVQQSNSRTITQSANDIAMARTDDGCTCNMVMQPILVPTPAGTTTARRRTHGQAPCDASNFAVATADNHVARIKVNNNQIKPMRDGRG